MMPKQKRLAYYITPHGFGHAVRSLQVVRQLLDLAPDLEIILVSTLPEFLLDVIEGRSLSIRKKRLDIGLVQLDSIRFDLDATVQVLKSLYNDRNVLLAEEVHFLKTHGILAVACDIPFLPFSAASQLGIPAIGISNFTWDWIYAAYGSSDSRWSPLVDWMRECYGKCDLLLQLPMHGDCSACPIIRDVPLVTRQAKRSREETRSILRLPSDQKVYLISFAYLELEKSAQKRVQDIAEAVFLYKHPLSYHLSNGICLDGFSLSFEDVVAAVDGVITKPGYGIVADCLAHGTPMIYSDRGFFPEYEVLVREMTQHLTTVYLPSKDLYSGRWQAAIEQLEKQPRLVPSLPCNGAEVCARIILNFINNKL
jgi:L-arabinokinase